MDMADIVRMMDAMNKTGETDRDRMRRYGDQAEECRAGAAKTKDLILTARPGLIQIAQLYEIMADGIAATLGDDTAPNPN